PPPSHAHNYRTEMHRQQRNRFEGAAKARLLAGVAQITRNRRGTFFSSICFCSHFRIGSIFIAKNHTRALLRSFPLRALQSRVESSQKTSGRTASPEHFRAGFRSYTMIKSRDVRSARHSSRIQEVLIFRALNASSPAARR